MNAMIPNKVRFGLDLQDLPARSVRVSYDELSLSGNWYGCRTYDLRANGGKGGRTLLREYPQHLADRDCRTSCGTIAYSVKAISANPPNSYNSGDAYYVCYCCYY